MSSLVAERLTMCPRNPNLPGVLERTHTASTPLNDGSLFEGRAWTPEAEMGSLIVHFGLPISREV
jgi:hypothetical protein